MSGKHFHEEWSFKVVFWLRGKYVGQQRFCGCDGEIFDTAERARSQMNFMSGHYSGMLRRTGEGVSFGKRFDAFEVYAPVRRIVTEWEDETTDEEVRK